MYAFLWRLLPGPLWLRVILAIIIVTLAILLMIMYLFPWLGTFVNAYDVTVEE